MGRKIEFEDVHGYQIKKAICFDNNRGFALAENPRAVQPFVTWQFTDDGSYNMYWGHYAGRKETAVSDYEHRVAEYRKDHPSLAEKFNYLAAAEMGEEQNYNSIDGVINNVQKPSILEHLEECRQKAAAQKEKPVKSTDMEL